jgi:hypothetical protein
MFTSTTPVSVLSRLTVVSRPFQSILILSTLWAENFRVVLSFLLFCYSWRSAFAEARALQGKIENNLKKFCSQMKYRASAYTGMFLVSRGSYTCDVIKNFSIIDSEKLKEFANVGLIVTPMKRKAWNFVVRILTCNFCARNARVWIYIAPSVPVLSGI